MGFHQAADKVLNKLKILQLLDLSKGSSSGAGGPKVLARIQTKTADYTCLVTDSGTIFTTYGDTGAINFTLPTTLVKGWFAIFIQSVDQNLVVTAGTADTLVAYNDIAADSLACSTSSHKVGSIILVVCDGNQYHAACISGNTITVGT